MQFVQFYWHLNGLNTYLAARMAWDADLDAEKVLDDFYAKFGGRAGPYLKAYWERIDRAYRDADCHAGASPRGGNTGRRTAERCREANAR